MKCIICSQLKGDIDKVLSLSTNWPQPHRCSGKNEILVRVLACSLAPGDIRVLTGQCDFFQSPKSFPYIPGGDICGIVEEVDSNSRFKVGDCVAVLFDEATRGGLAQYAVVKSSLAEIKPASMTPIEAACLPSSYMTVMLAPQRYLKRGDRILILGGSGGVGTALVQLAKHAGASFIAITSSKESTILESLGADYVINYTEQNWWEIGEFQETPFDIIFDLVSALENWERAKSMIVLKKEGSFVTNIGSTTFPEIHGWWDLLKYQVPISWRVIWTFLWPFVPRYKFHFGIWIKHDTLAELFRLVEDGQVKVVMDPSAPVPFTEKDVKQAFHLIQSRHAYGKVVVRISD